MHFSYRLPHQHMINLSIFNIIFFISEGNLYYSINPLKLHVDFSDQTCNLSYEI